MTDASSCMTVTSNKSPTEATSSEDGQGTTVLHCVFSVADLYATFLSVGGLALMLERFLVFAFVSPRSTVGMGAAAGTTSSGSSKSCSRQFAVIPSQSRFERRYMPHIWRTWQFFLNLLHPESTSLLALKKSFVASLSSTCTHRA